mgnify:CR=1 FL=1
MKTQTQWSATLAERCARMISRFPFPDLQYLTGKISFEIISSSGSFNFFENLFTYGSNNKINFKIIADRVFFVYSQKTDPQGIEVKKQDIAGRTIHYSLTQL